MVVADQLVQGLQVRPDPAMPLLRSHVPVPLLDLSAGCTVTENRAARIDAIVSKLQERWPYIDIDRSRYYEDDWQELVRDFLEAVASVDAGAGT
jgi:hypothetical protein